MLGPEFLPVFIREGTSWVLTQRSSMRRTAEPLTSDAVGVLAPYFPAEVLGNARLCFVDEIQNPPFYVALVSQGIDVPLDFRLMAGITFVDTIVVAKRFLPSSPHEFLVLLFHELVHVVQYSVLSPERFVPEYVLGWANASQVYAKIPLEVQAYELAARFASSFPTAFSVEEEVRSSFSGP